MKYKFYTKSTSAWTAMIDEMKLAKKSIYIEMYIFLLDTGEEYDFFNVLKEKALAGLKVIIVADARGSARLKKETIKQLQEAGVEILFFSDWLRCTHRKIFVVDERIFFLGGINIKKNTSHWHDLSIKVDSPLLTKNILRSFAYAYKMSGGQDPELLARLKQGIFRTIKSQFLEHWPNKNIYTLKKYYSEALSNAKSKIIIVTPYFTPPRWLMVLMESSSKRGIEIEVLLPDDTDVKILNRINRSYVLKLRNLDIKFYLHPQMNHAKVLLVDDKVALVGSQNLDYASFDLNLESGLSIRDEKAIRDLIKIIDTWREASHLANIEEEKVSFWDKFFLFLIKILYPIL